MSILFIRSGLGNIWRQINEILPFNLRSPTSVLTTSAGQLRALNNDFNQTCRRRKFVKSTSDGMGG